MRTRSACLRGRFLIVMAVLATFLLGGTLLSTTASAASTTYLTLVHDCQAPAPGHVSCDAIRVVRTKVATTGAVPEARVALSKTLDVGPAGGYTPAILASAYGYNPKATAGASQTVAVIEAYQDPNLESDLDTFDSFYNEYQPGYDFPAETSASFRVVSQAATEAIGSVPLDTTGWSGEQALDVETVRSTCRLCKILVVDANSDTASDLAAATQRAAHLGATEISNSYGDVENDPSNQGFASAYNIPHVVVTAASGDDGWYGWDWANLPYDASNPEANVTDGAADTPAAYSTVIGVGGTTLQVNSSGQRVGESVWNANGEDDSDGFPSQEPLGAGGSGCSALFATPRWQADIGGYSTLGCASGKRSEVDIAADADPYTGLDVYSTYDMAANQTVWEQTGGTSLATPLVAAMWALNGGARGLGYPALALYGHEKSSHATYDVTVGGNDACGGIVPDSCGAGETPNQAFGQRVACAWADQIETTVLAHNQCYAAAGFDGPTGVGTPSGLSTFTPLSPTAVISVPKVTHGHAAALSGASSHDPYPGGSVVSWKWTFGDGATSTAARPKHTWRKKGSYTVTLIVKDNYGITSARRSVRISVR